MDVPLTCNGKYHGRIASARHAVTSSGANNYHTTSTTTRMAKYIQPHRPMVWPSPPRAMALQANNQQTTRRKRILTTTQDPTFTTTTHPPPRPPPTEYIHPQNYAIRRHLNNICIRHYLGVQRLYALSAADPTWAARILPGRTDIAAVRTAGELLVTKCRQVTPTLVYSNHTVNGTCYALTPVPVDTEI
ncbi:hypothetical protein ANCDUO_03656 [Ancylostoma duodenale]|uniref:Uncharacterized protein n=1 Tax=Ancylostoma duodenale TaxID=51022 RepID=A0A0C2GWX3_9BILA|nr:hypothetical protein ANCDUO_03656 [Ancylostoma duodenale]